MQLAVRWLVDGGAGNSPALRDMEAGAHPKKSTPSKRKAGGAFGLAGIPLLFLGLTAPGPAHQTSSFLPTKGRKLYNTLVSFCFLSWWYLSLGPWRRMRSVRAHVLLPRSVHLFSPHLAGLRTEGLGFGIGICTRARLPSEEVHYSPSGSLVLLSTFFRLVPANTWVTPSDPPPPSPILRVCYPAGGAAPVWSLCLLRHVNASSFQYTGAACAKV